MRTFWHVYQVHLTSWGLAFLTEAFCHGAAWIHPSMHSMLLLSQVLSSGTAQLLLQALSRGTLPPSLISFSPWQWWISKMFTFWKDHYLLIGCSLQTLPASYQHPEILFSLEGNMTLWYVCNSCFLRSTFSKAVPMWGWETAGFWIKGLWAVGLWQYLETRNLGFDIKTKFLCIIFESFPITLL